MTVTMPLPSAGDWRSEESFETTAVLELCRGGAADSVVTGLPLPKPLNWAGGPRAGEGWRCRKHQQCHSESASPGSAKRRELRGPLLRPSVICNLSMFFISSLVGFSEGVIQHARRAWPYIGNRRATRNVVKLLIYNDLHVSCDPARWDSLPNDRFNIPIESVTPWK